MRRVGDIGGGSGEIEGSGGNQYLTRQERGALFGEAGEGDGGEGERVDALRIEAFIGQMRKMKT